MTAPGALRRAEGSGEGVEWGGGIDAQKDGGLGRKGDDLRYMHACMKAHRRDVLHAVR